MVLSPIPAMSFFSLPFGSPPGSLLAHTFLGGIGRGRGRGGVTGTTLRRFPSARRNGGQRQQEKRQQLEAKLQKAGPFRG